MAKTHKLSLRLDKSVRKLADQLCEAHGDLTLTAYLEGMIQLDAALTGKEKSTGLIADEELPRWLLYDFPIRAFRAAMAAQIEARTRDLTENSQEVDEALDAVQAKTRKARS